jgi:YHS domain-containing protein
MKHLFSLLVLAALSGATIAQAKGSRTEITCPLMPGHKANVADATKGKLFSDYKGRRYYFCCGGCKPTFDKNPAKYAKSPSLPTPKGKKV